jgi:hypothetical protein
VNGKGSKQRPTDLKTFRENYDRIFNNQELSERSLDQAIKEIRELESSLGEAINIHPTHFLIHCYPGETTAEFYARCAEVQEAIKKLGRQKSDDSA